MVRSSAIFYKLCFLFDFLFRIFLIDKEVIVWAFDNLYP